MQFTRIKCNFSGLNNHHYAYHQFLSHDVQQRTLCNIMQWSNQVLKYHYVQYLKGNCCVQYYVKFSIRQMIHFIMCNFSLCAIGLPCEYHHLHQYHLYTTVLYYVQYHTPNYHLSLVIHKTVSYLSLVVKQQVTYLQHFCVQHIVFHIKYFFLQIF